MNTDKELPTPTREIDLSLTRKEAQDVINLLNLASKVQGIPAAKAALPIAKSLEALYSDTASTEEGAVEAPRDLRLNENQCNVLGNLFHLAIQAQGLPAAEIALPIVDRISDALQSAIVPANTIQLPRSPRAPSSRR